MTTPSPFEVGRAVGNNVSGAFASARDKSAIDEILEQANASGDPASIDNAMRQILSRVSPERQKTALEILQNKQERIQKNKKSQEDTAPLRQGLATLRRQRELLKTGHLGPIVGIYGQGRDFGSTTSPEGRRARAEYERLGKSLISVASNIPIRNRQEFETLAQDLYDPSKSRSDIEGILDAMEQIVSGGLEAAGMPVNSGNALRGQQNQQTREMRDASGNVYDIPAELYEKARAQGLK